MGKAWSDSARTGREAAVDSCYTHEFLKVEGKKDSIVETKICLLFRAAAIMMKTGTVVTLKVAKFAADYHGLGSLLRDPTSEQHSGKCNMFTQEFLDDFVFFFRNPFQLLVTK